MKYHLRVYDNSHYMDESEAYDHGEYERSNNWPMFQRGKSFEEMLINPEWDFLRK